MMNCIGSDTNSISTKVGMNAMTTNAFFSLRSFGNISVISVAFLTDFLAVEQGIFTTLLTCTLTFDHA
jgi:hypothetical protein